MAIQLKRVYEAPSKNDGYRVLVERLWPRGLSKEKARIDLWLKEVAPSHELRKWFSHEPEKWSGFKERYFAELQDQEESLQTLKRRAGRGRVTFVYASREQQFNGAVALKEFLERT